MGRIIDANLGSGNPRVNQGQSGPGANSQAESVSLGGSSKSNSKKNRASTIKLPFNKNKKAKLLDVPVIGGSSSNASQDKSATPRAAVTKADRPKRTSATARASKMRANEGGGPSLAPSNIFSGRAARIVAIFAVISLAAGLVFYGPLKTLYIAHREHAQLLAEEAAVQEREEYLETKVDELSTPQGIEAEAANSLGLVPRGENTAEVQGLKSQAKDEDIKVDVVSQDIQAPETWYSPLLDAFFGVNQT